MRSVLTLAPLTAASSCCEATRTPAADVAEHEDAYFVRIDLPGLTREDIQITVENAHLEVKADRRVDYGEGVTVTRRERPDGTFTRRFRLGRHLDSTRVSATYENGVLELRVPKAEAAKPKRIQIA